MQAQIDSQENSVPIPAIESEEGDKEKVEEIESKPIENKGMTIPKENKVNGLSVPKKQQPLDLPKKEFSMFNKEKFGNPAELYKKQIDKHTAYKDKVIEGVTPGNTENQYLGDIKVKASKVNIVYRDYGAIDGDVVRIFVNDDIIGPNVFLNSTFSGFKLDLQVGFNKIEFLALNEGDSKPNTAEVQVLDESGSVIFSSQWALATGVKATIILIKD